MLLTRISALALVAALLGGPALAAGETPPAPAGDLSAAKVAPADETAPKTTRDRAAAALGTLDESGVAVPDAPCLTCNVVIDCSLTNSCGQGGAPF